MSEVAQGSTEFNVTITATCLEGGYLRVRPRDGDVPMTVAGKHFIKAAAPVESRSREVEGERRLAIRYTT